MVCNLRDCYHHSKDCIFSCELSQVYSANPQNQTYSIVIIIMDSEVQREGRLLDIVDDEWRKDKLPNDDIEVPIEDVPDLDSGNDEKVSLKEEEKRWTDVAVQNLSQEVTTTQRT